MAKALERVPPRVPRKAYAMRLQTRLRLWSSMTRLKGASGFGAPCLDIVIDVVVTQNALRA